MTITNVTTTETTTKPYKVRYYMTAGTLTSKRFATVNEALKFTVERVKLDNLWGIDLEP